jgi:hypothetical protein
MSPGALNFSERVPLRVNKGVFLKDGYSSAMNEAPCSVQAEKDFLWIRFNFRLSEICFRQYGDRSQHLIGTVYAAQEAAQMGCEHHSTDR